MVPSIFSPLVQQPLSLELQKTLQRTCLTESTIPTPLKVTIETPEQHLLCCSCAFIVDFEQILSIGFHVYLTYFIKSCFYCFEHVSTI